MTLYTIEDKIGNKTGPTFEAVNHAVAVRYVENLKSVVDHAEEFAIYQLGHLKNYGTPAIQLVIDHMSWDMRAFISDNKYNAVVATATKGSE